MSRRKWIFKKKCST